MGCFILLERLIKAVCKNCPAFGCFYFEKHPTSLTGNIGLTFFHHDALRL